MPKKTLRLFEINFNCLQESSKRSSSVEATTISATLQATNALPEIHSGGHLIGKVHLWTVVWKEELTMRKSSTHLFLSTAHSPPTPATVHSLELDSWNENCGGQPWSWKSGWITRCLRKLCWSLPHPRRSCWPWSHPCLAKLLHQSTIIRLIWRSPELLSASGR